MYSSWDRKRESERESNKQTAREREGDRSDICLPVGKGTRPMCCRISEKDSEAKRQKLNIHMRREKDKNRRRFPKKSTEQEGCVSPAC